MDSPHPQVSSPNHVKDTREAFHGGVVVAIPFSTHGRSHPETVKHQGKFPGAILAAPIRVVNQAHRTLFGGQRSQKGRYNQILCHTFSHGIAYDFSGTKILVTGKIQPSFPGGNVSDIVQPDLIQPGCRKLLIQ